MERASFEQGNANLLKLAALLDSLPPGRFDYTRWVGSDWKGKPDLSCGTTACALGWATTIPEFGLELRKRNYWDTYTWVVDKDVAPGTYVDFIWTQTAGKRVFHLTNKEFELLFLPHEDEECEICASGDENHECELGDPVHSLPPSAGAKRVAQHIRAFVEQRRVARREFDAQL